MVAITDNTQAYETYQSWAKVPTTVSATVDGVTETYQVYLVITNEALGLSTTKKNTQIMPKYSIKRDGPHTDPAKTHSKVDRWRIVKRKDNGQMEVWTADGSKFGGWPCFRVWPVPCDEYR